MILCYFLIKIVNTGTGIYLKTKNFYTGIDFTGEKEPVPPFICWFQLLLYSKNNTLLQQIN